MINLSNIYKVLYTCTMIIPLMFLCIFPVRDYIKNRTSAILLRFAVRFFIFLLISIPLSYLTILPTKFLLAMCAGAFFSIFINSRWNCRLINRFLYFLLCI